jgi:hypothetical protein
MDFIALAEIISMVGLALGALMGLGALISPQWAAGVVRLIADPARPGGYAEFRATYGGLLMMVHGGALALLITLGPSLGIAAVIPVALGWFGAAMGRTLSLILDTKRLNGTGLNPVWVATELLLGVMIGLPAVQLFV